MHNVIASFYAKSGQFHYVKLEIDGVFISGIKVSASKKYEGQVWIQMPTYKQGKDWKRYIEIANDSPLGREIYERIEEIAKPRIFGEAGREEDGNSGKKSKDVIVEDFDENKPIDLSEIPF